MASKRQWLDQHLIEPWISIQHLETRQNARAVAMTTLLAVPLGALMLATALLLLPPGQLVQFNLPAYLAFMLVALVSYVLARRGAVRLASTTLITTMTGAIFAASISAESTLLGQINVYYLVPVMLATVLVSVRAGLLTLIVSVALCMVSILVFHDPVERMQMVGGLVSLLVCGVFSVVTKLHLRRIVRMRAEALEVSEARLRLLTDNMSDAISMSEDGVSMSYFSPSMRRVFGLPDDINLQNADIRVLTTRLHPDDERYAVETFSAARRYSIDATAEYRWHMADDTYHWIETQATSARSPETKRLTTIYISRDITQRKEAELAVTRERELLRTVIDALPDNIFIKDRAGHYLVSNRAHTHNSGYASGDELAGLDAADVHAEAEARIYLEQDAEVFGTGQPIIDREYTVTRADGIHYYTCSKFPLKNERGDTIGLVGMARDVSERRRLADEQQKRQLLEVALHKERELGALKNLFMVTVSHEFRTPLATILSSSELLETYGERMTAQRRAEALATVREQVVRLSRMLDDIRTLLHLQTGSIALTLEPVDVLAEVQSLVNACVPEDSPRSISVTSTAAPQVMQVDKLLLRQIVSHVVNNAIQYSPPETAIEVTVGNCDPAPLAGAHQAFCITVRDHGQGIQPDEMDKVFAPFFRGRDSLAVGGTGLGLTIVSHCVDMYGGRVAVESAGAGAGTEVTVSLPVYTDTESEARRIQAQQHISGQATVDAVLQSAAG
jgi:PAS domain S-box-containing protein